MTPTMYWFLQDDGSITTECVPDTSILYDCPLAPRERRLLVVDSHFLQEQADVCLVHPGLSHRFAPHPFKDLYAANDEAERRAALIR